MIRYFLFPFRAASLLLVIVFTVGLSLCLKAGLLGLAGDVLFVSWFFKYCFVLLDAVIAGAEKPPVLDIEMVNPVSEQRPLAQAGLIVLGILSTVWVGRTAGTSWGELCGVALILVLPASIAVLAYTGNVFRAAWPPDLLDLIHGVRWHYAIPLAVLILSAAAMLKLVNSGQALWMDIGCAQILLLLTISLIGGVVHEHRFELGIDTLTREERESERVVREHISARAQMLDRAYGKFNVRKPLEGWDEIQKWLAAYAHDDLFIEHRTVLLAASAWPDVRPADRLASDLIASLLSRGRTGEALEVLEARLATHPQFRPVDPAHTLRLAELAGLAGKRSLRRMLDPKAEEKIRPSGR